jgi:hypothetical protein
VENVNLHLSRQPPSVPHQLPGVVGDPGSNSEPLRAHQAVVSQHQEGEEGVQVEGRKKNCTAYAGHLMMKQSECLISQETWDIECARN